jgi:hypothetical protein
MSTCSSAYTAHHQHIIIVLLLLRPRHRDEMEELQEHDAKLLQLRKLQHGDMLMGLQRQVGAGQASKTCAHTSACLPGWLADPKRCNMCSAAASRSPRLPAQHPSPCWQHSSSCGTLCARHSRSSSRS